jgi:hypothetical protein
LRCSRGTAELAKVEIHWPWVIHQILEGVKVNQFLEVREPETPSISSAQPVFPMDLLGTKCEPSLLFRNQRVYWSFSRAGQ